MVEQALSLLTLYIIWKARGLTNSDEPSPEEARLRDRLKECRDALLEKLLEFAIGTQSNTSDGVKRAVGPPSVACRARELTEAISRRSRTS